jgi:hypothetical protein
MKRTKYNFIGKININGEGRKIFFKLKSPFFVDFCVCGQE